MEKKYGQTEELQTCKDEFISVVSGINTDGLNSISFELCEDNYVGTFSINSNAVTSNLWFCKNLRNIGRNEIKISEEKLQLIRQSREKIILIVLESPHIDEFNKSKCSIAPAPALGVTGCNLDNHFIDNIKKYIPDGKYHIILSNAIQFQCSLGEDTDKFRDRIWLKLWLCRGFDKTFIKRLEKYSADIIVNLCTIGSHKLDSLAPQRTKTVINKKYLEDICDNEIGLQKITKINKKTTLQELTQLAINEYSDNKLNMCIKGTHPSSWYSEKNIRAWKV
ncbi:hypothetical protein [Terrisporobacter vanillatitrophus]|uniref:hypothetical protein n=1 Tax=Terrisporobacter vanillatitrophus TaxID=3058402 RepID=UPI003368B805